MNPNNPHIVIHQIVILGRGLIVRHRAHGEQESAHKDGYRLSAIGTAPGICDIDLALASKTPVFAITDCQQMRQNDSTPSIMGR
jgi:hypothetical protein